MAEENNEKESVSIPDIEIPQVTGIPPKPETTPTKKPEVVEPAPEQDRLSAIRTFEGDVAEALKGGESLSSIALKEQQRRQKTGETLPKKEKVSRKSLAILALVVVLIAGGSLALYFALFSGESKVVETDSIFIEPIIFADEDDTLDVTLLNRFDLIDSLSEKREGFNGSVGTIKNIYLTTGAVPTQRLLTGPEFLNSLGTRADEALIRNIGEKMMFGVHSFDGNDVFLIFKIKNFEVVFARMLEWEETLFEDLDNLFYQNPEEEFIFETEGEVNTNERREFRDLVIKSRDTRALSDLEGKTALIYAFPDRSTLVITTNSDTLSEIFTRLTASRF